MSEFSLTPKGPEAIQRRISEIYAKVGVTDPRSGAADFEVEMKSRMKKPDMSVMPFDPLSGRIGDGPSDFRKFALDAARKVGIEPELYDSLIEVESNYNPMSRSRANAMGLAQLIPDTARQLGVQDPYDPKQNLEAGARYLRQMLDRFNGDKSLALAAYNAGPGAVERAGGIPNIAETQKYVPNVLRRYELKRRLP